MKYNEAIIKDVELYWQSKDMHNILPSEESKLQNNLDVCKILFLSKSILGNIYHCAYVLKNLRVVISE